MLVMKFGGTSLGTGETIAAVGNIIAEVIKEKSKATPFSTVVVASAMAGVTDALLSAAKSAAQGNAESYCSTRQALLESHRQAVNKAITDEGKRLQLMDEIDAHLSDFEAFCRSVHILGELTARGADAIASLGERLSVRILAAVLQERELIALPVEATEFIITDNQYGSASPIMDKTREATRARLLPLLSQGVIPVVTGFIGATVEGVVTTLGRGGSDYTAAVVGSCLEAQEIWIWTDVDGVMTADPSIVPEAKTLPQLSYAEAVELSYFGARVIHPKTMLPAVENGIPLRIKNTFSPEHPGTLVMAHACPTSQTVKSITAIRGLSLVTVEGRGMMGVPGIAARLFSAVAHEGISVLMISQSSSEQNICFVIRQEATKQALEALQAAFDLELARRNVERIWAQDGVAIIAAVGAGMKGKPGIAAKVFGALGGQNINILSMAQGSSEYNISLVVEERDVEQGVRAIHHEFKLGDRSS